MDVYYQGNKARHVQGTGVQSGWFGTYRFSRAVLPCYCAEGCSGPLPVAPDAYTSLETRILTDLDTRSDITAIPVVARLVTPRRM